MTKINVSELEGAALDWAVANAVKPDHISSLTPKNYRWFCNGADPNKMWSPSTDWSQGGPIVDELLLSGQWQAWRILEGVTFMNHTDEGLPLRGVDWGDEKEFTAKTTLVAAMRAKVATEIGDTIDVPEELLC